MSEEALFTEAEAVAMVGRFVRARRSWSGIPGGARGLIVGALPVTEGWALAVSWNVPKEVKRQTDALAVSRRDFEVVLEEIDG